MASRPHQAGLQSVQRQTVVSVSGSGSSCDCLVLTVLLVLRCRCRAVILTQRQSRMVGRVDALQDGEEPAPSMAIGLKVERPVQVEYVVKVVHEENVFVVSAQNEIRRAGTRRSPGRVQ